MTRARTEDAGHHPPYLQWPHMTSDGSIVRKADTARLRLDQNLPWTRFLQHHILQLQFLARLLAHGGLAGLRELG